MRASQQRALLARARRRRRSRRGVVTTALALAGALLFSVTGVALDNYNYYTSDLPDPSSLNPQDLSQATQILDRNGKLLYLDHRSGEIRTVVPLAKISPNLWKATVDLEDRNFFTHSGLDYERLAGAAYADVTNRQVEQGGSTITQQLAKFKYLTKGGTTIAERSIDRKLREALLAQEIEARYSKEQILEAYLNEIFYGHEAYGVEAASEVYFSKHASELNLAEATFLAGIPAAPAIYDPLTNDGFLLCRARQKDVLDAMVRQGDLTDERAREVALEPLVLHHQPQDQVLQAPHFVVYVLEYLRQRYGSALVDGGGLKVTTTLDLDLQTKAEAIVRAKVAQFGRQAVNNGAMVALNPNTGEILAYVGSADYYDQSIDGAVDNVHPFPFSPDNQDYGRQPGSSFKPYVYLTALANGYQPGTIVDDTQQSIGGFTFHDFDNRSEGHITLRQALVRSRNIPAVLTLRDVGYQRVFQTVRSLGITTPLKPELGTAIGSSEIHMLEHASAYGAFATEGIYRPANPILKISDASGKDLCGLRALCAQRKADGSLVHDPGKRVISPAVAYVLNDILLGYAKEWSINLVGPAAGKSGTTDNGADLWYMGYTPDLVVASWMAHTGKKSDGSSIGNYKLPGLFGVTTAVFIFKDFLATYYGSRPIPQFVKPAGVSGGTTFCFTPSQPQPSGDQPAPPPRPAVCSHGDVKVEN